MYKIKSQEDILKIDKQIRADLTAKTNDTLEDKKEKMRQIDMILSKFDTIVQYKDLTVLKEERDKYQKDIDTIYNEELLYYIKETSNLIEKYKDLLNQTVAISFVKTKPTKISKTDQEKQELVSEFLKIASNYIYMEKCTDNKISSKCSCGSNDFILSEHNKTCMGCGEETDIITASTYSDINRINVSIKYTYDKKLHFTDTMYQYQGKQNTIVNKDVYDTLERSFEACGLLSNSKVKCDRYKNITKDNIFMCLKENNFSKHYINVTLIYCNMTGKRAPDISHLEDKLLSDYSRVMEVYNIVKDEERKSSLNSNYILLELLLFNGEKCDRDDFSILKTVDRLGYHNEKCKEVFDILEWTFTEIR